MNFIKKSLLALTLVTSIANPPYASNWISTAFCSIKECALAQKKVASVIFDEVQHNPLQHMAFAHFLFSIPLTIILTNIVFQKYERSFIALNALNSASLLMMWLGKKYERTRNIYKAIKDNNLAKVTHLIQNNPQLINQQRYGATPLQYALYGRNPNIYALYGPPNPNIVALLVAYDDEDSWKKCSRVAKNYIKTHRQLVNNHLIERYRDLGLQWNYAFNEAMQMSNDTLPHKRAEDIADIKVPKLKVVAKRLGLEHKKLLPEFKPSAENAEQEIDVMHTID